MKVSYFVIFLKNFFIYSNELRPVKAEIRLNGGRLRGSLLYFKKYISLLCTPLGCRIKANCPLVGPVLAAKEMPSVKVFLRKF